MPVNLSASGNVMNDFLGNPGGDTAGDADNTSIEKDMIGPSFASDDLLDVNQLFEIRGSQ